MVKDLFDNVSVQTGLGALGVAGTTLLYKNAQQNTKCLYSFVYLASWVLILRALHTKLNVEKRKDMLKLSILSIVVGTGLLYMSNTLVTKNTLGLILFAVGWAGLFVELNTRFSNNDTVKRLIFVALGLIAFGQFYMMYRSDRGLNIDNAKYAYIAGWVLLVFVLDNGLKELRKLELKELRKLESNLKKNGN